MFGRRQKAAAPAPAPGGDFAKPRVAPRSPSEVIKPMMAPPPPIRQPRRPRGGFFSALSAVFTLAAVLAVTALLAVVLVSRQANERGPLAADKLVLIPRNSGVNEIAGQLEREGVIRHPFLFQVYAMLNRSRGQLRAGEYSFKAGASIDEAIDTLVQGRPILHSVTVPEGLTSEQIVERLKGNDILVGEIQQVPAEGTLMPDTYKFERGMSRQQIVKVMQDKHRETLNQIWARRAPDLPFKTPQDLVVMASIVEKETGRADERTRVASVFINRLGRRMRLQSDPTIVYGLVGGKGTLGRGILRSEIERPTPYNTYTIDGLPPGPIANPGRAALEAVANPSRTKDLFFVADGTGGHTFAETYDQHQRNVARWRQIERSRPAEATVDRVEPPAAPEIRGETVPAAGAATSYASSPPSGLEAFPLPPGSRSRSLDASEGTRLDPLKNKTYDLNSAQLVPTDMVAPLPAAPAAKPRAQRAAKPKPKPAAQKPEAAQD